MGKDIISWMRKNSRVFRHAGSFLSYTKKRDSMLMVGPFAASLAPFYRSIGFNGLLYSFDASSSYECSLMYTDITEVKEINGDYSIISAPLYIQGLGVRELTRFLFDCYDALEEGGLLYISFPDAIAPSLQDKTLVDSFYSEEKIYMKYYTLIDILQSSESVGFKIASIEMDDVDFHDRLISLALLKNNAEPM